MVKITGPNKLIMLPPPPGSDGVRDDPSLHHQVPYTQAESTEGSQSLAHFSLASEWLTVLTTIFSGCVPRMPNRGNRSSPTYSGPVDPWSLEQLLLTPGITLWGGAPLPLPLLLQGQQPGSPSPGLPGSNVFSCSCSYLCRRPRAPRSPSKRSPATLTAPTPDVASPPGPPGRSPCVVDLGVTFPPPGPPVRRPAGPPGPGPGRR